MGSKSGSKAADKEAKRARAEEEARQQRIRQGTQDINRIFDGGTFGSGKVAGGYDPKATYYNADGTKWAPTISKPPVIGKQPTTGGKSVPYADRRTSSRNSSGNPGRNQTALPAATPAVGKTAAEQFAEMMAGGGLFSGVQKKSGFDDKFYRGIRDGYTNYAMPQLTEQRNTAAKDLTFSLARSGQLDGSVRGQKTGELQKLFDINEQQVRDQALAQENSARSNVENARSDLVAMLNATGDNQQAVNSALSRSTILTQPQAYSPLGQLFTDFTAQLGNQAARERAYAAGGPKPLFNTGWFGGQGQVTVRR